MEAESEKQKILFESEDSQQHTSQSINGPLLKLLERDLGSGRHIVEIQTVGVVLLLVGGRGELLLFVVEHGAPLGVDAVRVLPDHGESGSRQEQYTIGLLSILCICIGINARRDETRFGPNG